MFRTICNYLAVLSLSLIVGGSALANPLPTNTETMAIVVDETKNFSSYNVFLLTGRKSSYTVKVEAGKEVRLRYSGTSATTLKIQTPDGQIKSFPQDKYFDIILRAEGEYVVELESLFISQYSLKVFNK